MPFLLMVMQLVAVTAAETGHSGLLYIDTVSGRHVTFDAEL